MFAKASLLSLTFLAIAHAQQVGTNTAEVHPALTWQKCTKSGGCTNVNGKIVLDSNWRWLHTTTGYTNCYTGNKFDTTLCPDGATCAKNCALDGADYSGTYGISTSGNALKLNFITQGSGKNIGSRVYLMDDKDAGYQPFKVMNQEFSFDVDVSNLGCGLNGALYFSEMDLDGGVAKNPGNKAGAKYGTGYCDSQCPRDLKFINGAGNVPGWTPNPNDSNAGTGPYGACCQEMDIWEANNVGAAYTPHPCKTTGLYKCSGDDCAISSRYSGVCDPDGCDFNSYRMGQKSFYGKGMTVDTSKKFTVVTQFITSDNTASGSLTEIRRLYVQNGKVIANSNTNVAGVTTTNSISTNFCTQQKKAFGDTDSFTSHGGLAQIAKSFQNGVVLVMSVWDDHAANMLWLDSTYPTTSTAPGAARGTCPTTSGAPADVESQQANASVTYSNIRFGDIGSTYTGGTGGTTTGPTTTNPPTTTTTTTTAPSATQTKYGQCGGQGWSGPTACASGSSCQCSSQYYCQCL